MEGSRRQVEEGRGREGNDDREERRRRRNGGMEMRNGENDRLVGPSRLLAASYSPHHNHNAAPGSVRRHVAHTLIVLCVRFTSMWYVARYSVLQYSTWH